ncbi:hypothetical protein BDF22DRAFT_731243 [Syncephalis plumigaleata]|nr:hypothetical protein BDF22DRAFT_731243 [Syncephalis plumigaleata]
MKNFGTSSCKQSSKLANADANMEHIHSHNKTRSDTDLFFKPMKTHKQHRVTDMFKSAMKISTSLQMNIFKTKNNHGTKVDSAKMIKKSTSGSFYSLPSGSCSDSALFLGRYLYSTSTIAQAQPSSEQQHCDKLDINDEQSHATESTIELASVPMTNTKAIVANTLKLRVPSADCINRSITSVRDLSRICTWNAYSIPQAAQTV